MTRRMGLAGLAAAAALLLGGAVDGQPAPQTPPDDAPSAVRGAYLVRMGDCAGCHTAKGGAPFAGGFGLKTPFGTIYSTNITPDVTNGIGAWTPEQFHKAMQHGVRPGGGHLYGAMPFPNFTRASDADIEAIRAWLMTLPPVNQTSTPNRLAFPINIRGLLVFWNALNFKPGRFQPDPSHSDEWNRGAYIVTGLGHCGGCHTPKNALGGDRKHHALEGGEVDGAHAPNLTDFHAWSAEDIATYLRTGENDDKQADGPMKEVIELSTAHLSDPDLHAIAVYLKSLAR